MKDIADQMKLNEDEYILLSENLDEFGILDTQKIASFVVCRRKHQILGLLRKAIDEELSKTEREIIIRHWFEGESKAEIARQLDVPKSTVSRQIERAYDKLRAALKYVMEYQFEKESDTIEYLKEAINK